MAVTRVALQAALAALTGGWVIFSDSNGLLTGSTNLTWDNAQSTLSPSNISLGRYGNLKMNYDGTNNFQIGGDLGFGSHLYINRIAGTGNLIISSGGTQKVMFLTSTYDMQLANDSAAKPSTNTWTIVSDERLKKNIIPFTDGLSIIKQLNPIRYQYTGDAGTPADLGGIGISAQAAQPYIPYCISSHRGKLKPDLAETDILTFNSHALTFILVNAIKELATKVAVLEAKAVI